MNKTELYEVAYSFRVAITKAIDNREFNHNFLINNFPKGCCGITSDMLGRYLIEHHNIRCWYVCGSCGEESHAWLELENNIVLDITGDQYNNRYDSVFCNIPVYVGDKDDFHNNFSEYYLSKEIAPTDWEFDQFGCFDMLKKKMNDVYNVIIEYM